MEISECAIAVYSPLEKNMTIHLYIQTEHICKGTVQSKLADNATARATVERGTRVEPRDTVPQEDRLGSSWREGAAGAALDLDRTQQTPRTTRGTSSGLTRTQRGKRHRTCQLT